MENYRENILHSLYIIKLYKIEKTVKYSTRRCWKKKLFFTRAGESLTTAATSCTSDTLLRPIPFYRCRRHEISNVHVTCNEIKMIDWLYLIQNQGLGLNFILQAKWRIVDFFYNNVVIIFYRRIFLFFLCM